MAPYLEEVEKQKNELVVLKDKIATLKNAKARSDEIREALAAVDKAMKEAQAKVDNIDAAVYDLKALNPRVKVERDTRGNTGFDCQTNIAMVQALERLRSMI